ncbi:MAG: hypothetical protein HKN31_07875 [Pricia sp.]|nr:hypothetical protein [Pricia sp.]
MDVGTFYFYKNFMVAEIKEGIALTIENATEMLQLAKEYFGNKTPFVYITNRIKSYSFNPTDHFKTVAMFPNLKGYATVTYDDINHEIAELEQSFMLRPSKNFRSLEEAIAWVDELIIQD